MKWLINLLQKPRSAVFLVMTMLLLLYWLVLYIPTASQMRNFISKYADFYDDSYPTLTLNKNQVTMTGTIPFVNRYKPYTWAIFDTTGTIQKLPEDAADGSFFITQDSLQFRYKNKLRSFPLKDINVDSLVLAPPKVRKTINWLKGPFVLVLGLAGFIGIWLAVLIAVFIGTGIIYMIDAFSNGNLDSKQITNLALFSIIPAWLFSLLKVIFSFPLAKPILFFILIYVISLIVFTIYSQKKLFRQTVISQTDPF